MRTHLRIAELAARQHGVVAHRQLRELGFSESSIGRRARAGILHRVHHGVYAVGNPLPSPHGRCLAAVFAAGEGAVLSRYCAAWVWGMANLLPRIPEVTASTPRSNRPNLRIFSARTLHPDDLSTVEGIPVTAVARTLLGIAAASPRDLGRWALPRAKRLDLLDLAEIDALLSRSKGMRGARRLERALRRYRRAAFTRSEVERMFVEVVERAGLPLPVMNLYVGGFELDAYWPDLRYAVELDTYEYHGDEISFEDDRVRHEDLKLAGIEMTRVTGYRLSRRPANVAARLRRLLAQRRREIGLGV